MAASRPTISRRGPSPARRIQPLYHQLYVQLRQILTEGAVDPARPLPSEPALAEKYGVSRVTLRKTLDRLQEEGLIRRVHGVGTFPNSPALARSRANISGLLENLISFEKTTTAKTLSWEMVDPPADLQAAFGAARCLRIVRVRSFEGRPISFTHIHVPAAHAGLLKRRQVENETIAGALERLGIAAEQAEQAITAVAADAEAARHLQVEPGSPLVAMRRLMLGQGRRVVLHQESLYAPDRFEYRMTLSRMSIGPAGRWTPIA